MGDREPFLGERMLAAAHLLERNGFGHWYPPHAVPGGHLGFSVNGCNVTDLRPLDLVRDELNGLSLETCPVTDDGVAHLAGYPVLRRLELAGTRVTDAVVTTLAELPALQALSLAGTTIGNAALPALARLPNLMVLDLTGTLVSDEGVQELATAPALESLTLRRTRVTVRGLVALQPCSTLRHVTTSLGWRDRRTARRSLPGVDIQ